MKFKIFDVFSQKAFGGNPTGVIYWDKLVDKELMQKIAKELNLPDTIFLFNRNLKGDLLFESLTFTPYSEVSICGQGIIAAIAAIREDTSLNKDQYTISVALGKLNVILKQSSIFTSLGKPIIKVLNTNGNFKDLLNTIPQKAILKSGFVDLGRNRIIIETDLEHLESLSPNPSLVMSICKETRTTGLVFFAKESEKIIRSRHFTTSLNGIEDAVTGGASGAILAFVNYLDSSIKDICVHQGDFQTRGGFIYTYLNKEIYIGGEYIKIGEGSLVDKHF